MIFACASRDRRAHGVCTATPVPSVIQRRGVDLAVGQRNAACRGTLTACSHGTNRRLISLLIMSPWV